MKYFEIAKTFDRQKILSCFDSFDMINFFLHCLWGNRFLQITGYMKLESGYSILFITGTENNLAAGIKIHQLLGKAQAADTAHIDIQKRNIDRMLQPPEAALPVPMAAPQ